VDIDVSYRGGIAAVPSAQEGTIALLVTEDAFVFEPGDASERWWPRLTIPFIEVVDVTTEEPLDWTADALMDGASGHGSEAPPAAGRRNVLNFSYLEAGLAQLLRVQAADAATAEAFQAFLSSSGIRDKFVCRERALGR